MLLRNYTYRNQICGHYHSGITDPTRQVGPHKMRSYFAPADIINIEQNKRDSFPTGTNPPYSFMMGDKGTLLSSTTIISGDGNLVAGITQGINIESSLAGSGTITDAQLSLIVQLASSLSGSGTITVASLVGVVSLSSSLTGTGSLTAGLSLISSMSAALNGSGTLTADLKGILSMSAAIYVNQSEATIQELVDGVWNALAANYNNAGTMGEIMNNMGAVADPWSVTLEGTYTAGDIMKILSAVAAGKTTIVDLGDGNATVTFRDINDTVDRVIADMTESERTTVTIDTV